MEERVYSDFLTNTGSDFEDQKMFVHRLYIAGLTFVFLSLTMFERRVGLLEATVIVCALLFLILDIRKDVEDIKHLEPQMASCRKDLNPT